MHHEPLDAPQIRLTEAERADGARSAAEADADLARTERHALGWAALGAVVVIAWIVLPVGIGIFLGALIAFILQPLHGRMARRLGQSGSALVTVAGAVVTLVAGTAALVWLFGVQGAALGRSAGAALRAGGGPGRALDLASRVTSRFGVGADELGARVRAAAESAAAHAASLVEVLASTMASLLLALFFAILTMHFLLRRWARIASRAQEVLPLRPDYTRQLFDEVRIVGRSTLLGTIVTGLAQGVLATIGYAIFGVPEVLFFGAATALASLIPAVGTLLVWVPAGVVLILGGHTLSGVGLLAYGGLVIVGVSDYLIRPRLVRGEGGVPSIVTFTALFGGVEAFGLKGLVLGPVLMSLALAVLRIYGTEARSRRLARADADH
jgi:predicted PurR-regulated permease PerM